MFLLQGGFIFGWYFLKGINLLLMALLLCFFFDLCLEDFLGAQVLFFLFDLFLEFFYEFVVHEVNWLYLLLVILLLLLLNFLFKTLKKIIILLLLDIKDLPLLLLFLWQLFHEVLVVALRFIGICFLDVFNEFLF